MSVKADVIAMAFKDYLIEHLLPGPSLDVGCGPQYKPGYIPPGLFKWVGIDPLPGKWFDERVVGEMEDLRATYPHRFDNVLFTTSLDHCYDPAKALMNAHFRLNNKGRLFIWFMDRPTPRTRLVWWKELWKARRIKVVNGIPFYAPLGCPDPFHRRYLTLKQILKWTNGMFKLVNIEEKENRNIFLCFKKR